MSKPNAMATLKKHGPELRRRFGLRKLSVFGSVARGEAVPGSDVDLLVEFEGTPDVNRNMELEFCIEDLLGRKVVLARPESLRPRLRPGIEQEAVAVA